MLYYYHFDKWFESKCEQVDLAPVIFLLCTTSKNNQGNSWCNGSLQIIDHMASLVYCVFGLFGLLCAASVSYHYIVWRNFSILNPKLVSAYAENILSDSRLKNCAKSKSGWCKSVGVENFEIWAGQQKVREHGSGALRKWQTKLRKWCKLGKEKKRKIWKEKRTNGKWGKKMKGKRRGRGKEKDKWRGQNILKNYRVTILIYGILN